MSPSILSTAEARRDTVVSSAIAVFAKSGYLGTPIAAVAEHAHISPAYVFKLFPGKETLFIAALDECFARMIDALDRGANHSSDQSSMAILTAMGDAYADLIEDRDLLMLQVHAQSAASDQLIAEALRRGLEKATNFVRSRSGASDENVQRFFAYGQLCHLLVTAGIDSDTSAWASILNEGFRH